LREGSRVPKKGGKGKRNSSYKVVLFGCSFHKSENTQMGVGLVRLKGGKKKGCGGGGE